MAGNRKGVQFDRATVIQSLEENGYAVIPNVLDISDCDLYIKEYKDWAQQVEDTGISFRSFESLIQGHRIGHFNASWCVRLKVKDVFAQIWQTDKLLSSVDAVALSYPPEQGSKLFAEPNTGWLHIDQGDFRVGCHAYQGAVYLEEATSMDHCLRVLSKSHLYHEELIKQFPDIGQHTRVIEHYRLDDRQRKWYIENNGCKLTKVPVPKGGMVLWDSRTVHDNSRPEFGRPNKDRWRHMVLVCMTPAAWATDEDIAQKRKAYNKLLMTTHWPSRGVSLFPERIGKAPTISKLPDIAKTFEVKQLMGIEAYDFEDGEPNGPDEPKIIPLATKL